MPHRVIPCTIAPYLASPPPLKIPTTKITVNTLRGIRAEYTYRILKEFLSTSSETLNTVKTIGEVIAKTTANITPVIKEITHSLLA